MLDSSKKIDPHLFSLDLVSSSDKKRVNNDSKPNGPANYPGDRAQLVLNNAEGSVRVYLAVLDARYVFGLIKPNDLCDMYASSPVFYILSCRGLTSV